MIVLDANVLFALFNADHEHHERAARWFEDVRAGIQTFGAPSVAWHAVVRLATNRKVIDPPASHAEVFAFVDVLRGYHDYRAAEPGPRHLELFRRMCESGDASGNLVTDAAIAAIAIENGAAVASFDRDFARFTPQLRWIVPGE